jgi:hypothetical protein
VIQQRPAIEPAGRDRPERPASSGTARWLPYSSAGGNLAVIDTTAPHRTIKLGSLVKDLLGTPNGFSADWSGQASAP